MIQIDMDMPKSCADCPCGNAQDGWCYVHNEVLERMENGYPSTETRPEWCPLKEVKHGKWIYGQEVCLEYIGVISVLTQYRHWECSVCGYRTENKPIWNYCPKCGCRMDKE